MSGQIFQPEDLKENLALSCDVCVIGSGAGGSVLAAGLVCGENRFEGGRVIERGGVRVGLIGMVGVRCSLAALAAWLELSVEWVFAALLGDWLVKSLLLVWRFRSGRWQHAVDREESA